MMSLDELIEIGDPDGILREVDRLSGNRDWEGIEQVAQRCRLAVERGKQLWGAASHAEYRLVLEAPAEIAARHLDAKPAPFLLGPLPEVIASTHSWDDLAPHLQEGPGRGVTAYECVVRGVDLEHDASLTPHIAAFEMPLALRSWEPDYALAIYRDSSARFPRPAVTRDGVAKAGSSFELTDGTHVTNALASLVTGWTADSNGIAATCVVEGGIEDALVALEVENADAISAADATNLMAWAGASGGFHGRRRGMSVGRSKAWWVFAEIGGLVDDWPAASDEIEAITRELEFWTWGTADQDAVELSLAICDPVDGVTYAIQASDKAD